MELTAGQQELLEFERRWPRYSGGKVQAVSEFFDLTHTEYESRLVAVLTLPAAKEYAPALVRDAVRWRAGVKWFNEKQRTEWV